MSSEPFTPKKFQYAEKFYKIMEAQAEQTDEGLIFSGSKTKAFGQVGVTMAYYSSIVHLLEEIGSIQGLQRGNSARGSRVLLIRAPTMDMVQQTYLTRKSRAATMQDEIELLKGRLPEIDLNGFIVSIDSRLREIELRLSKIEGGTEDFAS